MYRKTQKAIMYENMRKAKEKKRLEQAKIEHTNDYFELPTLRKEIIITNYDFKKEVHVFQLLRTNRIDQYQVVVDGTVWKEKLGLSGILAGIRKSMPRVQSIYKQ